jgi:RimJ/RimL family protein N-acetyltransferase
LGDKYLVNRTTEAESWLARQFQGRGIGTATRQVIAACALDHLDAQHVTLASGCPTGAANTALCE